MDDLVRVDPLPSGFRWLYSNPDGKQSWSGWTTEEMYQRDRNAVAYMYFKNATELMRLKETWVSPAQYWVLVCGFLTLCVVKVALL
jgi:hypothetical protein